MLAVMCIATITFEVTGFRGGRQVRRSTQFRGLKEETHAARWGLLRGYSGKATKWVDFVVTGSTRGEPCHGSKSSAEAPRRQENFVEKPGICCEAQNFGLQQHAGC